MVKAARTYRSRRIPWHADGVHDEEALHRLPTAESVAWRRRRDVFPLSQELVVLLRDWVEGMAKDEALWPGSWCEKAARMIRRDLELAKVAYRDEAVAC